MITIQAVRVVRDFSSAKFYYTVMAGDLKTAEVTRILRDAAPFLRHELGRRMKLRTLPELHFIHDETVEQGERLSHLIDQAIKSDADKHTD